MKILHGTWIPKATDAFIQTGAFYLWVETDSPEKRRKTQSEKRYSRQLVEDELVAFLTHELGIPAPKYGTINQQIVTKYFILPSTEKEPLPSLELARYLEDTEIPEDLQWQVWKIDCYQLSPVIKLLNYLHFLCLYSASEIQIGSDLLFWYHYTQSFKQVILKDQYIPALKYRELSTQKGKGKKTDKAFEIYPTWEIISESYEAHLKQYLDYLPLACTSALDTYTETIEFYDKETLLRHFSECLLNNIIKETAFPTVFRKKITDVKLLNNCLHPDNPKLPWTDNIFLEEYKQ